MRGVRNARVVYGDDRLRDDGYRGERDRDDVYGPERDRDRGNRDRDRREDRGRAVPRDTDPAYPDDGYPQRNPSSPGGVRGGRLEGAAHPGWASGYRDGQVKGREDAQKNRSYQPDRHQWYRSGSRGYDRQYGLRGAYANIYRDGFTAGYDEAFGRR